MPVVAAVAVSVLAVTTTAGSTGDFDDGLAPFELVFKGQRSRYEIASAFVLPGEALAFEVRTPDQQEDFAVEIEAGRLSARGRRKWMWSAPKGPGRYELEIKAVHGAGDMDLNVFVLVPFSRVRGGYLNGYRIGSYPRHPRGNPLYAPPAGFIEVKTGDTDTKLTPHFELGQFVSKQRSGFPKYVVLQESLLLTLEGVLELLNRSGIDTDDLHVMSGYRTPFYNKAIGNVDFSLHQWGAAADIFVDDDDNGRMDDVNDDGQIDVADARRVYSLIDRMSGPSPRVGFAGGLGLYDQTRAHGPFVHVDVRGRRARWGG